VKEEEDKPAPASTPETAVPEAAVPQAEPTDVQRFRISLPDHPAQAEIKAVTPKGSSASGQPVDLHVPLHGHLALATRRASLGIEPIGEVRDRLVEALPNGGEMPLVVGDQRRVALCGKAVGKGECAGGQGGHGRQLQSENRHLRTKILPS